VVGVLVGPNTVWLEYWLGLGLCGWSTCWTQYFVVGVLVGPRTVCVEVKLFNYFNVIGGNIKNKAKFAGNTFFFNI